jgi:hypothetical protein
VSERAITASLVLGVLGGHIGAKKGITARDLAFKVWTPPSHGGTAAERQIPGIERQVRKLIQELRTEGFHICGTPDTGYFMAENADELDRTCMFLYARAMTTLRQIARMKKVSLPDLRGQLKLPT